MGRKVWPWLGRGLAVLIALAWLAPSMSAAGALQQYRYEFSFGPTFETPSGQDSLHNIYHISIDSQNNVYVTDSAAAPNGRVVKFDSQGRFLAIHLSGLNAPWQMCFDGADNAYLVEVWPHHVVKYSPNGTPMLTFGRDPAKGYLLNHPQGCAVDAEGNLYVSEYEYRAPNTSNAVVKFRPDGTYVKAWAARGTEVGQTIDPCILGVDSKRGFLYVDDDNNRRIQRFDLDGENPVHFAPQSYPAHQFGLDDAGNIYAADWANKHVLKLSPSNELVAIIGGPEAGQGQLTDAINAPAIDHTGAVYVYEITRRRISKFVPANHPPVANAGPDQTVEQASAAGTQVTLDGSGSSDPDGDALTYAWTWPGGSATGVNPTITLPLGTTTVTLVVNDGQADSAPDTVDTTVRDTTPPVLVPPEGVAAEQTSLDGTPVALGEAAAIDVCDSAVTVTNDAPEVFPLGETVVTWTATDASGNVATTTQKVAITDTTAPAIESVWATPDVLWSPNHKMVDIAIGAVVGDICDATPAWKVVGVTCNEAVNGQGDGNTSPDWAITGDHSLKLRAERSGKGSGRVYTITIQATDASGNAATATCTVTVPHDQKKPGGT